MLFWWLPRTNSAFYGIFFFFLPAESFYSAELKVWLCCMFKMSETEMTPSGKSAQTAEFIYLKNRFIYFWGRNVVGQTVPSLNCRVL